jgi:GTP-binding protein
MPFVDEVTVKLKAGTGGDGCLSFRREKFIPKGGPDGGDGGRGADVVLLCDENSSDLSKYEYEPEHKAPNGQNGMGAQCAGKDARDLLLKVPEGTAVYDTLSGKLVAELLTHGQEVRLLKGGRGGLGNIHFKSSVNRAPRQTTKGKPGQEGEFRLELKSIADVGLVGFPNAGKSSLINCLTNAQSKVAAYPFTTLNPHLGRVRQSGRKIVIADIPGLVEGASENRGLGLQFLRHIERCKLLLFVIDAAGSEGRKPADDLKALLQELENYNPAMLKKPRIVVANKIDLLAKKLPATFAKGEDVIPLSCVTGVGIDKLKKWLEKL